MKCANCQIAVCTWSLQTDIQSLADLMKKLQLNCVHLAIAPALAGDGKQYLQNVKKQNWMISSTMIAFPQEDYSTLQTIKETGGIVPDACWDENRKLVIDAIAATSKLQVKYLSFHAGFIDAHNATAMEKMLTRIRLLADAAAAKSVTLLLETGQETADELLSFLEELNHPAVAVNFDPANMILYNKGNPIAAVKILAPWIKHVHIKDAIYTTAPSTWGTEMIWGKGEVHAPAFLNALRDIGYKGTLAIEREAGSSRFHDISLAVKHLKNYRP